MSDVTERTLPELDHDHEWRYTARGQTLHAVHGDGTARCGGVGILDPDDWHGGGSQAEHERLMLLPLCLRCRKILGLDVTPSCRICRMAMPDGRPGSFASNICGGCVSDSPAETA